LRDQTFFSRVEVERTGAFVKRLGAGAGRRGGFAHGGRPIAHRDPGAARQSLSAVTAETGPTFSTARPPSVLKIFILLGHGLI
jgi:hypothetical protein